MLLLKVAGHVCETVAIVHTVPLVIFFRNFGSPIKFFFPHVVQVLLDLKSL
jgi:hypothetical protein